MSAAVAAAPFMPTAKEMKAVLADRRKGLFETKHTYNEAWLSFVNMEPADVVFSLGMRGQAIPEGKFGVLNLQELLLQIRMWQEIGVVCRPCNVKEVKFGTTSAWAFTVQPTGDGALERCGFSPLSLAFGTMVSGYTYVAKNKGIADLVVRALEK